MVNYFRRNQIYGGEKMRNEKEIRNRIATLQKEVDEIKQEHRNSDFFREIASELRFAIEQLEWVLGGKND